LWALFASTAFEGGIARSGVAAEDVVALLDYEAYFRLMKSRLPDPRDEISSRVLDQDGDDVRRAGWIDRGLKVDAGTA
jgi:hypothetical protein